MQYGAIIRKSERLKIGRSAAIKDDTPAVFHRDYTVYATGQLNISKLV